MFRVTMNKELAASERSNLLNVKELIGKKMSREECKGSFGKDIYK